MPRQRFDRAADALGHALRRNLDVHRRAFIRAAALVRAGAVAQRIDRGGERLRGLSDRLTRCYRARAQVWANRLQASGRLLDSVSHKAVLERGFALVRGADGTLTRRAAQVVAGERLTLTFADGNAAALAESGKAPEQPKKVRKKEGQGTLF